MRVGFIGLGVMGRPMALNLLRGGHALLVHTRTATRAQPVLREGGELLPDAASVARHSEVVITMLPDSPEVEAVAAGAQGIFAGAHAGLTWIDMSTISPLVSRALAARALELGIDCLDAPVSGGERGAVEATLSIMVGGPELVFERCLPLLKQLGRNVVHLGSPGAGQVAKACNQVVVGAAIAAVAEALVLGERAGVDPTRLREALLGGLAHSRVLEVHGQRMIARTFEPGFRARLHRKDLRVASELAARLGVTAPLTREVVALLDALLEAGGGDLDHSALVQVYEAGSGKA